MKPIKLEDLRPQPASFRLRKFSHDFLLRPVSLADDAWLRETFGAEVEKAMSTEEGMVRLAYRLMAEEDKAIFKPIDRTVLDENGETKNERVGGWRLLLESIEGIDEKTKVARALIHTRGISAPVLDEIIEEEMKKKELMANASPKSAGEPSLISSPPSTDGALSPSGASPSEKSPSPSAESGSDASEPSSSRPHSTGSSSSKAPKEGPPTARRRQPLAERMPNAPSAQ